MKIKLQDYSLISSEWIDKEIEKLNVIARDGDINKFRIEGQIISLLSIKQQLIPSEKLAEVCFDNGFNSGMELSKQEFLESEIEIL
jgi:hypothetical protein